MVIAALDTGNIDLADSYVHKLVEKFPDSVRVKRLEGMVMEYEGQLGVAKKEMNYNVSFWLQGNIRRHWSCMLLYWFKTLRTF